MMRASLGCVAAIVKISLAKSTLSSFGLFILITLQSLCQLRLS